MQVRQGKIEGAATGKDVGERTVLVKNWWRRRILDKNLSVHPASVYSWKNKTYCVLLGIKKL